VQVHKLVSQQKHDWFSEGKLLPAGDLVRVRFEPNHLLAQKVIREIPASGCVQNLILPVAKENIFSRVFCLY
jgi:hypothetical protein